MFFVKEDLKKAGHYVKLSFATQKATMQNLDRIVIADKMQRCKNAQTEGLKLDKRKMFVQNWYKEHEDQIIPWLGSPADENQLQFLNGIFFAPSFVKQTVPQLQKVFMADACHLHFGKYTLFSCYGMTANSNASPVAFAILFGNKNTSTWRQFWKYCRDLHRASILVTLRSSPTRTRVRKMPFPSIFNWWGIFTVCFIVSRTLLKYAEEVGGKFLIQRFGCTIS
jgi:hypothetical protein